MVTTNNEAAAFYRQAQQALVLPDVASSLCLAVTADPGFGLAVADLDAITASAPESSQWPPDELGAASHRNSPQCRGSQLESSCGLAP